MRFPKLACLLAFPLSGLALASPALADQSDQISFAFSLGGLPAGQVSINGQIGGNDYAASGVVATSGLLGALARIRYDATVKGTVTNNTFRPAQFDETAQRGSRKVEHRITFKGGVPVSVTQTPPRKPRSTDVDPAKQGGTIDPLTALYAVLRDVDRNEACKLSVYMYDGSKRTRVTLNAPQPSGNGVICSGEYRRIAGFSAADMAEKTVFPFTLTYAPAPEAGRLRVVSIVTDTILGKGRLTRQ